MLWDGKKYSVSTISKYKICEDTALNTAYKIIMTNRGNKIRFNIFHNNLMRFNTFWINSVGSAAIILES
jgi:hypothetical protein